MTKPLRIALIMQGGSDWMGGMEYIRNIILALSSLPQDLRDTFELSLLAFSSTDQEFIRSVRPAVARTAILDELARPTLLRRIKGAVSWHLLKKPFMPYDDIIDKSSFDFVYPYVPLNGLISMGKGVAWIYDFQHKYLPEFFPEQVIKDRDREFSRLAERAPLIVLSSRAAEADFRKFYPGSAARTEVLSFFTIPRRDWYDPNPLDVQHRYSLPDRFFIVSNQFWQHKNHLAVFKALKLLKNNGVEPAVVCTGHIYDNRRPEYSDLLLQSIHRLGLARQVYLLGLLPRIDQIQLMRRSIALIQPSLFEGWSTVVEDARCLGKHCILSDFPVLREQNPPDSRFFDRTSPESLAEVMADRWQTLSPGPHPERETQAGETNRNEVRRFAQKFLEIAGSAAGGR